MRIKVKTKNEALELLHKIEIMPYEKFVDIKIEYPNGYFGIFNNRDNNNQFIPSSFRYTNNGNEIKKIVNY